MTLLNRHNWAVGMEVILTHPDPGYSINSSNPLQNTQYACKGVITQTGRDSVHVEWENGQGNSYKAGELTSVDMINDGASGNCESIWQNRVFDEF